MIGAVRPLAVKAVVAVIAVLTVAETVCVAGDSEAAVVTVNEMVAVAVSGAVGLLLGHLVQPWVQALVTGLEKVH